MSKINITFSICILTLLYCLGCGNNAYHEIKIAKHPDLYSQVIGGSGIDAFVGKEDSGDYYNDTLFFDTMGRLIKREDGSSTTRWQYDSNNYLIRRFHFSDVLSNYLITHEFRKDTLYEYWFPLKSPTWEYKLSDIDSSRMRVSYYLLHQGKTMKHVDSYGNKDVYQYDYLGKLIKVEKYSQSGELAVKESYHYESGKLIRVDEKYTEGEFFESIYFTSGTLDSIVDRDFTRIYSVLDKH